MSVQTIVPAAGAGTRLKSEKPKALVDLGGKPLLVRTLLRLQKAGIAEDVIVLAPPDNLDLFQEVLEGAGLDFRWRLVPGGSERQISVSRGIEALPSHVEWVVIHDAARPFVPVNCIHQALEAARAVGAATVAIPCTDTILVADSDCFLVETPERKHLWACQTPQVFRVDIIVEAHRWATEHRFLATDDATLVRSLGNPVRLVMGSTLNFKITTPTDLLMAGLLIERGFV
ncbi:MAG TPA: 2-C-methyl-D-erythritol 4-phosphate cytidylyltransferase [Candidatus Hydrogenedentes bacterium]|nr:2-C-methyl-D-erythritol 4-phosphate cytidylyltransferase [Candidatus Hydrogenedentota bacterium]HOL77408.1 2-C-methyl-D-erythritol 4-phosphate cytidylyltransferase [Candidatus Hydrogenedentota bacterium]HPO84551.1 2-C-methyl-D-erythritol 4-phosphate cytidylyltransferase [Candidatus Hydrogenedentota bacterium]